MRLLYAVLFLSFSLNSFSQNLVRNWSFEDTVSCPTSVGQLNKALYWFSPRGGGGSSEYFNSCSNYKTPNMSYPNWTSIPKNAFGTQLPMNGNSYAGIGVFVLNDPFDHEYIETKLLRVLDPAINYYVEFWVSLADKSAFAIANLGAFFSVDTVHYLPTNIMNLKPQIVNYSGIVSDTFNWVKVSGYFKPPNEGYQFLTIGNFNTNDSTNYQLSGNSGSVSYYYIDNVVVIDSALQHTIGIESYELRVKSEKFEVYPNPANSDITLEFSSFLNQDIEVRIFNVMGNRVLSKKRFCQKTVNIDVSKLRSGIYFIRVSDESGRVYSEKLIVE